MSTAYLFPDQNPAPEQTRVRMMLVTHRQRLTQIALVLLGLVALVLWLRSFDIGAAWETLRNAAFGWALIFVVSHALMVVLRAVRWRQIIHPLCPLPWRSAIEIFGLGEFLNASFSMRSGDVAKAAMLRQEGGLHVASGLSLLFADKIFELWGLISITLLGLVIVLASSESVGGLSGQILAFYPLLMIFMVAVLRLLATDRAGELIRPIGERSDWIGRIGGLLYHATVGLRAAAHMPRRRLLGLALLSSLIYAIDGLSVVLLFWAVGAEVSAGKVMLGACMIALIFLIPVPGNIGTLEAGFALFFGQLAVAGDAQIAAVAILFHAGLYLSLLLLALGSFRRYGSLLRSRQPSTPASTDGPPKRSQTEPVPTAGPAGSEIGTRV